MSSKSTIFLTNQEEHCFHDCTDNTINIEINSENAKVTKGEYHFIELTNEDSDIYKLFRLIQTNSVIRREIKRHLPDIL